MTTAETVLDETDRRLLALLAKGLTGEMIARRLEVSNRTLRRRVRDLCRRLEIGTPIEAVVWAAKQGLV